MKSLNPSDIANFDRIRFESTAHSFKHCPEPSFQKWAPHPGLDHTPSVLLFWKKLLRHKGRGRMCPASQVHCSPLGSLCQVR